MSEGPFQLFDGPQDVFGRVVDRLARLFAVCGGALVTAITLMAVFSIVGRAAFDKPIPGDFELVQVACAVAVAAFLPHCQMRRGHIIVDFFTTRLGQAAQSRLDALGALLFAVVMFLVAWRTGVGAQAAKSAGETTMIMGFPIWIAYLGMAPSFAVAGLAGLHGAWASWRGARA